MYIVQKGIDIENWNKKEIELVSNTTFGTKGKDAIRKKTILPLAVKEKSILVLHGPEGEDYNLIKKEAPQVRIKAIDDGRFLNNKKKFIKEFKNNPEKEVISIRNLAKKGEETFGMLFVDYCGPYGDYVENDIEMLPRIMKGKGHIAFTFLMAREHICKKGATREEINTKAEKRLTEKFATKGVKIKKIKEMKYQSNTKIQGRSRSSHIWMRVPLYKYVKT